MTQTPHAVSPQARRTRLLEMLEREGEHGIDTLADLLDVSSMTIRRDLQVLAEQGRVVRTHGGAAAGQRVTFEFRFLERVSQQAREKEQIAQTAITLLQPGQSVMLDSGTTTLAIARQLPSIGGLTVVTTSLPIASELFGREGLEVIILGGNLRKDAPDLTGALTEGNLEQLRVDVAFLGADTIDHTGYIYNRSNELGRMLSQMARAADKVYAVADHTKVGHHALMRFAHLRQWHGLITDPALPSRQRTALEKSGVHVITSAQDAEKAH